MSQRHIDRAMRAPGGFSLRAGHDASADATTARGSFPLWMPEWKMGANAQPVELPLTPNKQGSFRFAVVPMTDHAKPAHAVSPVSRDARFPHADTALFGHKASDNTSIHMAAKLNDYQQRLQSAVAEKKSLEAALANTKRALAAESQTATRRLQQAQREVLTANKDALAARTELATAKRTADTAATLPGYGADVSVFRAVATKTQQESDEAQQRCEAARADIAACESKVEELRVVIADLETAKTTLNASIDETRTGHTEAAAALATVRADATTAAAELAATRTDATAAAAELKHLLEQRTEANDAHQKTIVDVAAARATLQMLEQSVSHARRTSRVSKVVGDAPEASKQATSPTNATLKLAAFASLGVRAHGGVSAAHVLMPHLVVGAVYDPAAVDGSAPDGVPAAGLATDASSATVPLDAAAKVDQYSKAVVSDLQAVWKHIVAPKSVPLA